MKKNKRKIKKGIIFLIVLFLIIIYALLVYFIFGFDVKNIYIYDNNYLKDQEIIDYLSLNDFPNFYTFNTIAYEKKLKINPLVKDVTIKKKLFHQIHIYITEYSILYKRAQDNKYVLSSNKDVILDKDYNVPILINYIPNTKQTSFNSKMAKIDKDVLVKISEIKYDPTDVDEDRFLFYMLDENYVYVTLTKMNLINKYNDAITQFEGKRGILYLDSGNYFEILS